MQPHKSTPQDLFSKPARYIVPIFQRGYVWTLQEQIKPLWRDVLYQADKLAKERADDRDVQAERRHFLGAIVLKTDGSAGARSVPRSEVIDGQQRLTTLQVLLIALRDRIAPLADAQLTRTLEGLTINAGAADPDEAYKVWPTSSFQQELVTIATARNSEEVQRAFPPQRIGRTYTYLRPPLAQAYLFFWEAIGKYLRGEDYVEPVESGDADALDELIAQIGARKVESDASSTPINPTRAELLIDVVTNRLQIIELRLESHDDAQIIFETLNARGAPLKAGDLVRNFVFLQAARKKLPPEPLYQAHWKHFDEAEDSRIKKTKKHPDNRFWRMEERQGRLTSVRLDLLLFHYLVLRKQDEFKFTHLYQVFREWWDKGPEKDIAAELQRLARAAAKFRELIERDQKSRFGLFAYRLRALDNTTAFPLVLALAEREEAIGQEAFEQALVDIESYLIRRSICGHTPKAYNRIFLSILQEISKASVDHTSIVLRNKLLSLEGDTQHWPTDEEVRSKWIHDDAYLRLKSPKVLMILEGIEMTLDTSRQEYRPVFDQNRMPSVEHVWPQHGDLEHWPINMVSARPELLEDRIQRGRRLIQSFGNLTLLTQPLNSSVGRGAFGVKRAAIGEDSKLRLNAYFRSTSDTWTESDIEGRAATLLSTFAKTWPHGGSA